MKGFALRRPCPKCPFRTDVPGYLRRARAIQISEDIANGAMFACHETTEVDIDDEGNEDMVTTDASQFCAGALILMEKQGHANQAMRSAERFDLYDAGNLDMSAPVHATFLAFADHHGEDEEQEELECCCVCDPGCEAPAGFLVGGFAISAEPTGEVHECLGCGESVCDSCSNAEGFCTTCAEYVHA